jgi:hypothetical protein
MRSDGFWPIGSVAQSSGGMLTSMLPTADSWTPQAEAMLDTHLPARRDLAFVRRPAMSRFTSVSPLTTRPAALYGVSGRSAAFVALLVGVGARCTSGSMAMSGRRARALPLPAALNGRRAMAASAP